MRKNRLLVGSLCISMGIVGIFLTGCKDQTAVQSMGSEIAVSSESASSENISLYVLPSSDPERNSKAEVASGSASSENGSLPVSPSPDSGQNSKEVILYTYDGRGNLPDWGTGDHKLVKELPEDVKEIKEMVRVPSDEITPDKVMKLYVEKFLSSPVGDGTMSFSYSGMTMSKDGIITVDFTKEGARYLSYGSTLEMIHLYGIGKTMLLNIEGAKAVCYGIEGGDYQTERLLKRNVPYLTI